MEENPQQLKTSLQTLGPLQPEAWLQILQHQKTIPLNPGESLVRKEGMLAYLSNGILKEYDASNRKNPSIINFIKKGQPIITRRQNQVYYLKACTSCLVLYWESNDIKTLHQTFAELEHIYRSLCAQYDTSIAFRGLLLEEKSAIRKIQLFISTNRDILPQLKKKDMANYLNLDYDYFVRNFHGLITLAGIALL
ncbi:Crp/Fnr family transcriptional regulator [Pedobacter frigiditerrae]|uniref:Crp/Fnr family transcriptional regulator n=1 Tax=Pedobacter frigiditerrae TaxID=2530452 RepID=A0A4R0MRH9_9SPHI|nr:Crp/Fnr family transcriptional regulator [Pedobacter frigiditerrae]TCC88644.1 Crp/Fnr family transcriptional regulator [Pedobacter frigiditerrae]